MVAFEKVSFAKNEEDYELRNKKLKNLENAVRTVKEDFEDNGQNLHEISKKVLAEKENLILLEKKKSSLENENLKLM